VNCPVKSVHVECPKEPKPLNMPLRNRGMIHSDRDITVHQSLIIAGTGAGHMVPLVHTTSCDSCYSLVGFTFSTPAGGTQTD